MQWSTVTIQAIRSLASGLLAPKGVGVRNRPLPEHHWEAVVAGVAEQLNNVLHRLHFLHLVDASRHDLHVAHDIHHQLADQMRVKGASMEDAANKM